MSKLKYAAEAIKYLLTQNPNGTSQDLWEQIENHIGVLEVQLNVSQGDGEKLVKKTESGYKETNTFTDGLNNWGNIRINADLKNYSGRISRSTLEHAAKVGTTGWDYENQVSIFVGFDFDGNDHAGGLSPEILQQVKANAVKLPYVQTRYSTGGQGLHLYVEVPRIPTRDRGQHKKLADSILKRMGQDASFDFSKHVDCAGAVLWFWSSETKANSFQLIKQATEAINIDWKQESQETPNVHCFSDLTQAYPDVALSTADKKFIDNILTHRCSGWDAAEKRLNTHTCHIAAECKTFKTISRGTNLGEENCYCFPLGLNRWRVVRHGKGTTELDSWDTKNQHVQCIITLPVTEEDTSEPYRALRTEHGQPAGYVACVNGNFDAKDAQAIKTMLAADGLTTRETTVYRGQLEKRPWTLSNVPFEEEYPGNRRWNRNTYQRIEAVEGQHPHTTTMLNHLGSDLDDKIDDRCRALGITCGGDWLQMFFQICVQRPETRLPWVSLFSTAQDAAGKSTLLKLWQHIFTESTYLIRENGENNNGWNDEEIGRVLMMLDESEMYKLNQAELNRRIDANFFPVAKRGTTKTQDRNYLHYVQATNELGKIPAWLGDTRVQVFDVPPVANKDEFFFDKLIEEAPAFLWTLRFGELPSERQKQGRLFLPVIDTDCKELAIQTKFTPYQVAEHVAKNLLSYVKSRPIECVNSGQLFDMAKPGMTGRQFQKLLISQQFANALERHDLLLRVQEGALRNKSRNKIHGYSLTLNNEAIQCNY